MTLHTLESLAHVVPSYFNESDNSTCLRLFQVRFWLRIGILCPFRMSLRIDLSPFKMSWVIWWTWPYWRFAYQSRLNQIRSRRLALISLARYANGSEEKRSVGLLKQLIPLMNDDRERNEVSASAVWPTDERRDDVCLAFRPWVNSIKPTMMTLKMTMMDNNNRPRRNQRPVPMVIRTPRRIRIPRMGKHRHSSSRSLSSSPSLT